MLGYVRVILTSHALVLALMACSTNAGSPDGDLAQDQVSGGGPVQDDSVKPVMHRQAEVEIGPLLFEGLYCWTEIGDSSKRHGKFGMFNPTDRRIRFRVAGESGVGEPGEDFVSDSNFRGIEGRCEYELSIDPSDTDNEHLTDRYETTFIGQELGPPVTEAGELVENFFNDLSRRDLESLRRYTEPPLSSTMFASWISWRFANEPVAIEVTTCNDPQFDYADSLNGHLLTPVLWSCDVAITYPVHSNVAGSGIRAVKVQKDLQSGRIVLEPGTP